MQQNKCPIWGVPATINAGAGDFVYVISSKIPGRYAITGSAEAIIESLTLKEKAKLTTIIVDKALSGEAIPGVDTYDIDRAKTTPEMSIVKRCDRLLQAFSKIYPKVGGQFRSSGIMDQSILNARTFAGAWSECTDEAELMGMFNLLVSNGYARHDSVGYVIEFKGWERIEEIKIGQVVSNQAFVAMWFHESMDLAYSNGIKPAIEAAGYDCMRIDAKEHANKIDDEIIAEIRRSKFIVSDFTSGLDQPRGGVYYEAGFAMGLGLPVIWTCREDMISNVHFDTRQFNHITWKDPADLRIRLERRIGAVIGDGPRKQILRASPT